MKFARVRDILSPGASEKNREKLQYFRLFLMLHVGVRCLLHILVDNAAVAALPPLYSILLWLGAATGSAGVVIGIYRPEWLIQLTRGLLLITLGLLYFTFPLTSNHAFLEVVLLFFCSFLYESNQKEGQLLLCSLRWIFVIGLFYSGLQKLLYGNYFDAQFLGYLTAHDERFQWLFQLMMPADEYARLASIGPVADGSGPYRVDSFLFQSISNLVVIIEIGLALILLIKRLRVPAVILTLVLFFAIELGAREIVFGCLMIALLLLFLNENWNKKLLPLWLLLYGLFITLTVTSGMNPWFAI